MPRTLWAICFLVLRVWGDRVEFVTFTLIVHIVLSKQLYSVRIKVMQKERKNVFLGSSTTLRSTKKRAER